MRQIKFRVWDKAGKCFLENFVVYQYGNVAENGTRCAGDEIDVEQFTGLLDRNGKEIYEGDVVRGRAGYEAKVFWDARDACWGIDAGLGSRITFPLNGMGSLAAKCEVIGDVHRNPELLTKK